MKTNFYSVEHSFKFIRHVLIFTILKVNIRFEVNRSIRCILLKKIFSKFQINFTNFTSSEFLKKIFWKSEKFGMTIVKSKTRAKK